MLSVIIPTCNRNDLLRKCLECLQPGVQQMGLKEYEVIVSDDSRNNIAKSLVEKEFTWAQWAEGSKKGPAANRNNGAKYAKGEWLVFIDDDCIPDKDLLKEYRNGIHNNPGCLAFEGAIFPDDEKLLKKDMAECPVNTKGGCFWSANICINTNLFKQIGGFDESYLIAAQEDQQLKIDIEKAMQKKIVFLKRCLVTHPVRFTSINKQIKKIRVASKNFSVYAVKNREVLGYTSILKFFLSQIKFHLSALIKSVRLCRFKSVTVSCLYLFYGVPLNVINYYLLNKKP